MSFDFRQLDELISLLEKKTTLSPGSPPVMEAGTLGIWRTIRGFRVFLELVPGAGKYNFDGKSYKGGRVMVGPPSLTGKDITNVGNDVWGGLSGSGTKESFNTKPTDAGLSALKASIRSSLKSDDTRRAAIDETSDLQKLVQIARSAGFTDSEIKESLGGKTFHNALDTKGEQADAAPDNVIDFKSKQKTKGSVEEQPAEELPAAAGAENTKPKKPQAPKPSGPEPGMALASGGEDLHSVLNALKVPGILNADKKRKIAEDLENAASKINNEFFRKQIEGYAHGLKTGDFKIEEVRQSVKELLEHRKNMLIAALSDEDINKLHDKAKAKDVVKLLKDKVAAGKDAEYTAETEAADRYFYEQQLEKLEQALRDPKVAKEVRVLRDQVRQKRLGGNSLILRLLQILRFILAFIPGV